jgi:hypothetical protein
LLFLPLGPCYCFINVIIVTFIACVIVVVIVVIVVIVITIIRSLQESSVSCQRLFIPSSQDSIPREMSDVKRQMRKCKDSIPAMTMTSTKCNHYNIHHHRLHLQPLIPSPPSYYPSYLFRGPPPIINTTALNLSTGALVLVAGSMSATNKSLIISNSYCMSSNNILLHGGDVPLHATKRMALLASNAFTHRSDFRGLGVVFLFLVLSFLLWH